MLGSLWGTDHVVEGGAEVHWLIYPNSTGFGVSHTVDILCQALYMLLFG